MYTYVHSRTFGVTACMTGTGIWIPESSRGEGARAPRGGRAASFWMATATGAALRARGTRIRDVSGARSKWPRGSQTGTQQSYCAYIRLSASLRLLPHRHLLPAVEASSSSRRQANNAGAIGLFFQTLGGRVRWAFFLPITCDCSMFYVQPK